LICREAPKRLGMHAYKREKSISATKWDSVCANVRARDHPGASHTRIVELSRLRHCYFREQALSLGPVGQEIGTRRPLLISGLVQSFHNDL
jgi:hypothetical protein